MTLCVCGWQSEIFSKEVTVFTCLTCSYMSESVHQACREAGHATIKSKTSKRFFTCSSCKNRTTTLGTVAMQTCCCLFVYSFL